MIIYDLSIEMILFELTNEYFFFFLLTLVLKKGYTVYKDHITLADYEIHNGMNLELYYS